MNKDLALFLLASLVATLNPTLLAAMIVMFLLPHPRRLMLSGKAKQPWQQRMLGKGSAGVTFAIGAVMSFPGVTYLNALHHVVALNLPAVSILLLVMYFCLMQQILLELALLAFSFAPGRTQAVVVQFRAWLASHGHRIAAFGLAGIGTLLVVRGAVTIS